jgi:hypothetical protein
MRARTPELLARKAHEYWDRGVDLIDIDPSGTKFHRIQQALDIIEHELQHRGFNIHMATVFGIATTHDSEELFDEIPF